MVSKRTGIPTSTRTAIAATSAACLTGLAFSVMAPGWCSAREAERLLRRVAADSLRRDTLDDAEREAERAASRNTERTATRQNDAFGWCSAREAERLLRRVAADSLRRDTLDDAEREAERAASLKTTGRG